MRHRYHNRTWLSYKVMVCWISIPSYGTSIKVKPHLHGLDVAIIGGGVAGLASAVSLKKIAGVRPTVFEAEQGFRHGGFGLALWPNGLRALHHMDISLHDEVVRSGSVIEERLFTTPEATNIDYCQEREAFGHPMICVRSLSLHNALRRTALQHGCNIVSGVQCHDILPASPRGGGDKKALLVLMHDEQDSEQENKIVEADFIVGADGLKSIVRAHQGDTEQPRDAQCVWLFGIVCHTACPVVSRTRVHTFFLKDPSKAAALMPVGDHTYWAVALTGEDRQEAMDMNGGHEDMKYFIRRNFGECQTLMDLVDCTPPHQIQRRRIEDRPAMNSFVSGVRTGNFLSALVGDAAHPARPSLGQGANMALEDAVQLALLLRETDSVEEALMEYDAARVLRCATLQGDLEFVAKRRERQSGSGWRSWGEDGQENRGRPANKGVGTAEFVYNWHPTGLRHFPWRTGARLSYSDSLQQL